MTFRSMVRECFRAGTRSNRRELLREWIDYCPVPKRRRLIPTGELVFRYYKGYQRVPVKAPALYEFIDYKKDLIRIVELRLVEVATIVWIQGRGWCYVVQAYAKCRIDGELNVVHWRDPEIFEVPKWRRLEPDKPRSRFVLLKREQIN